MIDASGDTLYSVRVRGFSKNIDCNNVGINFTYEVFFGQVSPQEMSDRFPDLTVPDTGDTAETRVPLVTR